MSEHNTTVDQLLASHDAELKKLQEYYRRPLYILVNRYIGEHEPTRDIVQDVFLHVWRNRETITFNHAVKRYLFGLAKLKALDYKRHTRVCARHAEQHLMAMSYSVDNSVEESTGVDHIMHIIETILAEQTPQTQRIFRMSRFEHLSIQEIADRTKLSHRTIENYISTVLTSLKPRLLTRQKNNWRKLPLCES